MSWKPQVSVLVLVVLAGLPVSTSMCALMCEVPTKRTAGASGHHGSGTDCEEPPAPSAGQQISGVVERNCTKHDATLQQASATAPEKTDWAAVAGSLATTAVRAATSALPKSDPHFDPRALPANSPPTITPTVLRV